MENSISPKYQMQLIKLVEQAIWDEFKSYKQVRLYINKWHQSNENGGSFYNEYWENFNIVEKENGEIDLNSTLHNISGHDLLKIAVDLGLNTPDFIPSIVTFKNELKNSFETAYNTFSSAYKQIETEPSISIGLANSALESIIKEILKHNKISIGLNGGETLYKLTSIIIKEFKLSFPEIPNEIKLISNSLLQISQSIEKLRSEKTIFHGKTNDDYLINDPLYSYFIINSVATVGMFLYSFYKTKYIMINTQIESKIKNVDKFN